jgi:hypothetical protein
MLGGDIMRHIRVAFQACRGGDEHNAPPFFLSHGSECRLHRKERAGEVDVERLAPQRGRNLLGRRALRAAGIGDHDGEMAAGLLRRPVELADRRDVGHVGHLDMNVGMPFRREFQLFGAAPANRDLRACLRQRKRDGGADTAAAAGHECVLTFQAGHRHTAGV